MEQERNIKSRTNIILWLFSGCFLIFVMVVVGGITRLTGSGLSITKWDVVTGAIPPITHADWEKEFVHYTETPQYKQINSHFDISDFKQIYWWEYIHRLIGRLIGIVFIIPFLWFLFTKQLSRSLILKSLLLFFLGGLQGFIGWYMVKSGLVDIPTVSHLRLALHLTTAFITFGLTFWFAFELIHTRKFELRDWHRTLYRLTLICFALTIIQIIYGAFVAGLKAGYIYNTWPLMGDTLIADSVFYEIDKMGWTALINSLSGVQVVHRYLAYLLTFMILGMGGYVLSKQKNSSIKLSNSQMHSVQLVVSVVLLQFVLGVFTLIYSVPVVLGVMHQVLAFFLFSAMIYLLHRLKRQSVVEATV
ncbi:MAG: COX15/CtaA family protein [Bacteroidota bacterium]|nr:COX15/CtaA family protein [Bacteroidota bacterium]